ncbi:hypothetical protein Vadar_009607 [Vaccinium darrowii]|uniref:Uncharacterized protein n=1 Tax=Vaccinium darrowii TaxID=229202 RepID=A0ACB7Y6D5_9ERIC|nr:hypothetical protein Vadar_009607 [Vaccinium darrowii]
MAPKEIGSCTGYLELMPHKTITLLDLIRILCSSNNSLANQEFIDVSESHHLQGLEIRWIIFLSLFAQKILLYLKKPMVWTRDVIEMWLNLLSSNGEYQKQLSTQAIMFKDTTSSPNLIVVAFRGTEPFDADQWRTDVDFSWYDIEGVGKIHSGFLKALGLHKKTGWPKDIIDDGSGQEYAYYTLKEKLKKELKKDKDVKFIVTGHSLGAALAILFVAGLVLHEEEELLESLDWVYTYGQPRVGNEQFGDWMGEKMRIHDVKYLRYVYCNDLVPRVPYDDQTNSLYKHFGPCLWVNSFYKGKVVWEEPDKNYFSLLWAIPKILNAVWELIRSFIIPYIYGPDYKESWFMKLVRVFGLLIPGLSAHCPQDYDNATRLGSFPPEILIQQVLNGSVVKPDKSSAKFVSVLGCIDTRVQLDKSIKTTDNRYCATLSIMASKLAYKYQAFAQAVITDRPLEDGSFGVVQLLECKKIIRSSKLVLPSLSVRS